MLNDEIQVIAPDGIDGLQLEVHLWSGKKRLRKAALIARNPEFANLPPESLATLGAIKICDPKDIKKFGGLKRKSEKLMKEIGLPVLGAFGFPTPEKYEFVYNELTKAKAEFDAHLKVFEANFRRAIEEWQDNPVNQEWRGLISDIPTASEVVGRLSFDFHPFRISAPAGSQAALTHHKRKMTGLKGELFEDGATVARHMIATSLFGKDKTGVVSKREKITWKTLRPLKRIGKKFASFSFLDPSVEPLAQMIEHVLSLMPAEGPIDGVHLMHIWTLAQTLADPEKAIEAAGVAYSAGASSAFEQIVSREDLEDELQVATQSSITVEAQVAIPVVSETPSDGMFDVEEYSATANQGNKEAVDLQPSYVGLF